LDFSYSDACKQFIGGKWLGSSSEETAPVINPSTGEVLTHVAWSNSTDVNHAVKAAAEAFPSWAETPIIKRSQVMFRYKQLLEEHFEELGRLVTIEHGKTLDEAKGSVRRGIEVVDFACGLPALFKGETLHNIGGGVDYETYRYPLGVCAGITPFNFPAMIPLWMFPIAITCGNTFILKPSPQTPLTSARLVELLDEAGLPLGVINLVHGGKETVDTILTHPDIKAISFVGSTSVAKYVYETGTRQGKRVQSAGGAKNCAIIMPDAEVEPTAKAIIASSFGSSGERCMAVSTIITVSDASEKILEAIHTLASSLKVGPTHKDTTVQMGPVISSEHLNRIKNYIEIGIKEGAELYLDGRTLKVTDEPNGYYIGPTIFRNVHPEMRIAKEEIFGPVLSVIEADNLDEAIEIMNKSKYGNAAVIFTKDGAAARELRHRAGAGMIGINVGVPAPMGLFPFSGWKDSFFGDLHVQSMEGVDFYTQKKVVMKRWF